MQFDLGIERQKSEFGEGRIVCGVGHLNEQVPAPLSAVVGEVHCFGFLLVEDRMDRLAERTGPGSRVAGVMRNVHLAGIAWSDAPDSA